MRAVIEISQAAYDAFVAQAIDEYPLEACGLIGGPPGADGGAGDVAAVYYPCHNTAKSARVYTIDPKDHLLSERDADDQGFELNGVVHSHTHSEPYPSPTDVAAAPDPSWHYVIVSLKTGDPEVRSYRIIDGEIISEPISVV